MANFVDNARLFFSFHLVVFFFWLFIIYVAIDFGEDVESSDSANVSDTEEYFEDFHLPMTHQNSMSTRRSFMRKIKAVGVCEPDADRIEGIVKSGQLNRHGSIRRKIVPQPQDFICESFDLERSSSPIKMTSTPNDTFNDFIASDCDSILTSDHALSNASRLTVNHALKEVPVDSWTEQRIDDETLSKIRDCLDTNKVKDLYTLGSRLQDLLSPTEIEEIISNSHRYGDVISLDVLLALSESRQDSGNDSAHLRNHPNYVSRTEVSAINQQSLPPDLIDSNDASKSSFLVGFFYFYSFSYGFYSCFFFLFATNLTPL